MAGALAAAQAGIASLVVVLVPVVLTWATAAYSSAPWEQAVRAGTAVWLLAHHTGLAVPGGHVGLVPLGLAAVPGISCWLAGVRLARALDPNADAIRAGVGRFRPVAPPPRALAALVLTYAGLVTLVGVPTSSAAVRPVLWQAFAGAAVLCALAATAGSAAWVAGGVLPGLRLLLALLPLPGPVRRCLRPVAAALAVQVVGALGLAVAALTSGWDDVEGLHRALAPGLTGGLVLVVGQLMLAPNLVVWAGSWAAGPGFSVGSGTSVTPGQTDLGSLPALPVLGALPPSGPGPGWAWAVLALPVLAGAVAGWCVLRAAGRQGRSASVSALLAQVATVAVVAGLGWTALGWLSSGPAGPGRLATVGASAWQSGLALAVEVGLGALLAVGAGQALRSLSAPAVDPTTGPVTPGGPPSPDSAAADRRD